MSDFVATERVRVEYSLEELEDMEDSKAIIFSEMRRQIRNRIIEIYDNQYSIAKRVVSAFRDRKIINVMVVAKTQSGKTGSMYATIKYFLEEENIPVENIYIITGLSSREWKKQTKERLPNSISQDNVFHRNELAEFADKIKGKKNILIIMDEIQIASTDKQTIFKSFQRAEQSSKLTLYENDVKILEYSATPNGTIYDLERWGDASAKILADPGAGYVGSFDLYNQKRVRDCEELYTNDKSDTKKESEKKISDNIGKIKWDLEDNYPDTDQRYHLIRTRSGPAQAIIIANFKKIFGVKEYVYINYDQNSEIKDINNTLENKPEKHTFIFIKEMLRCAKTLSPKYIGICYERYTGEPDDSVIIQGFIGRLTGYKDNGVSICYTNIKSILKYEEYWNSNFEEDVGWKSMTTKRDKNGLLKEANTFNKMGISTDDSDEGSTTDESTPIVEPTIVKRKEHQDIRNYYKDVLQNKIKEKTGKNGSGPRKKTEDDKIDGFYHANIRGTKRVYSFDEIFRERRCNVVNGAGYICHPCYRDTSDPTTLEWWLIHYY
jgi:hypothetical protein